MKCTHTQKLLLVGHEQALCPRRLAWGSGGGGSGAGGRRAGGRCAGLCQHIWDTRHGTGDILGLFRTKFPCLLEEVPLTSGVEPKRNEAFRRDGSSRQPLIF